MIEWWCLIDLVITLLNDDGRLVEDHPGTLTDLVITLLNDDGRFVEEAGLVRDGRAGLVHDGRDGLAHARVDHRERGIE